VTQPEQTEGSGSSEPPAVVARTPGFDNIKSIIAAVRNDVGTGTTSGVDS
jgi:hypothetical protein